MLALEPDVRAATERAVAFVRDRQRPSGEVPVLVSLDRRLRVGCELDPSIFPTAIAVLALAAASGADDVSARAAAYLAGEVDEDGLWRHWPLAHPQRAGLPPDLDDTALASAALVAVGSSPPANRDVVLGNRDRRGRFYTWVTPRLRATTAANRLASRRQLRTPARVWYFFNDTSAARDDVDAVVNANVVAYLGVSRETEPVLDWLASIVHHGREAQCDKWYTNVYVVWYAIARVLGRLDDEAASLIEHRLARTRPTSAMDAALAVSTLAHLDRVAADDAVEALLRSQASDGGWPAASIYTGGRLRHRDGTFAPAYPRTPQWGSRELTTALCAEALSRWSTRR